MIFSTQTETLYAVTNSPFPFHPFAAASVSASGLQRNRTNRSNKYEKATYWNDLEEMV